MVSPQQRESSTGGGAPPGDAGAALLLEAIEALAAASTPEHAPQRALELCRLIEANSEGASARGGGGHGQAVGRQAPAQRMQFKARALQQLAQPV